MRSILTVLVLLWPLVCLPSEPVSIDVFVGGQEGYPIYRIPAMVSAPDGSILAFCEGRKTGISDHGNIDLVLKRSFDRGATWGPLQVIVKKGFKTYGNPAPVVDAKTGTVWLPFCLNNDRVFVTWSDDMGATWAQPREITPEVKRPGWGWYATGPGHSIQLAGGRLLVPCDHRSLAGVYSHVIFSDDHGKTWRLGGTLDNGTDESMAVETRDGGVYLTMRNIYPAKLRAYARSTNGGMDWSEVELDPALVGPTCQASIIRLTSVPEHDKSRILFLNPASEKRENMAVRISYDEAKTWSGPRTIHPGPAAYSDMAVLPDLSVGALYENGESWPYSRITFTRIDLEWITNGEDKIEP